MKIVVLGSTGQLAWDLLRIWEGRALGLSHDDLDVTDAVAVRERLQVLRPDWVVNTAAFNRVDDCETDPQQALAVNTLGAFHVARAAAAVGAGVVYFSSDYVFSGALRRPYTEDDQAEPVNVYGVSKRAGEDLVRQANPRHVIVRTTGLYGLVTSRKGWTFPDLMLRKAQAGETVRVVADQVLTPTFTADLAAKVNELIERELCGLYHITNSGECSWFDFTRTLYDQVGITASVEPITTEQSGRRARRPAYSVLASARLQAAGLTPLRPWREALADYLGQRRSSFRS